MHIGHTNAQAKYSMNDHGSEVVLESTPDEKVLGVWINDKFKFKTHESHWTCRSKSNRMLVLIKRFFVYREWDTQNKSPVGRGTPLHNRGSSRGVAKKSNCMSKMNCLSYMPQFSHIMDIEVTSNSNFSSYSCFLAKYSRLLSRYSLFSIHKNIIFAIFLHCNDTRDSTGPVHMGHIYG